MTEEATANLKAQTTAISELGVFVRRAVSATVFGLLVSFRNDRSCFDHQDDRAVGGTGAVNDAFRHDEAFSRLKIDRLVFEINDEVAVQDEEELIIVVVLVPVILTLQDAEANHRVVDPA